MASIKDVAKLAGVSVATVSRVINNSLSVSEETREQVFAAISALNYSPNVLGRNLRKRKQNSISTYTKHIESLLWKSYERNRR